MRKGFKEEATDFALQAASSLKTAGKQALDQRLQAALFDVDSLRGKPPSKNGWLFVLGQRVVVPAGEVHVVTAPGWNAIRPSKSTEVFGSAAKDRPSIYFVNQLSSVVALKTQMFVVPIASGPGDSSTLELVDADKKRYTVDVTVTAQLDTDNTDNIIKAAHSVGHDMMQLILNIRQVAESQLLDAANRLKMADVVNDRTLLSEAAESAVNATLAKVGYKLLMIKIGQFGGEAYELYMAQSMAEVKRDTTVKTNEADLKTAENVNEKTRKTAQLDSETEKVTKIAALSAAEAKEKEELGKAERLAILDNENRLKEEARTQALDAAAHAVLLEKQNQEKARELKAARDEQDKLDAIQKATLARQDEQARQLAEIEKKQKTGAANASAEALKIQTAVQNQLRLETATVASQAAIKEAEADKRKAEATRATESAEGLALADVEDAKVAVAAKQVAVDREQGLAQAEIAERNAEAEIKRATGLMQVDVDRAKELGALMQGNSALLTIELRKMDHANALELARIQAETQRQIMTALAPYMQLKFNIIGDGGSGGQILSSILRMASGAQVLGEEVPVIGNLLGAKTADSGMLTTLTEKLQSLIPSIRRVVNESQPRVLSSMTVTDLLNAVTKIVSGKATLVEAVEEIRNDGNFQVIGNFPVTSVLSLIGIDVPAASPTRKSDEAAS